MLSETDNEPFQEHIQQLQTAARQIGQETNVNLSDSIEEIEQIGLFLFEKAKNR